MSEDIEKLIKIQGMISKRFHLCINTDLEEEYRWKLFIKFSNEEDYFSPNNFAILSSDVDSIDYLLDYLQKHYGLDSRWL